MDLIQVGKTGRPHGVKGEIKLFVEEHFIDDLFTARAILIGDPPAPFFVERLRGGGTIIAKLEEINTREDVVLLSNRPLLLRTEDVNDPTPEEDPLPFAHLLSYTIIADGYPTLGPIEEVI
ncbi:MAG: hypothetical protein AAFY41_15300, partial [Bacteroidota bacterium]